MSEHLYDLLDLDGAFISCLFGARFTWLGGYRRDDSDDEAPAFRKKKGGGGAGKKQKAKKDTIVHAPDTLDCFLTVGLEAVSREQRGWR